MRLLVALLLGLLLASGQAVAAPVTPPPSDTDLDYQLGGVRSVPDRVGIVVRDRRAEPVAGLYNVCYVNGFQTQPDEKRLWRKRRGLLLKRDGRLVRDEEWGEWIFDIRSERKRTRLARLVGRWIDGCAANGYDAVELDNLDSFSRSHSLVKKRHTKTFARALVRRAHRAGLAVGQKNWPALRGKRLGFDFAVAEECGRYDECGRYVATYGRAVLAIEYRRKDFRKACRSHSDQLPIVLRDRALKPRGRRAFC